MQVRLRRANLPLPAGRAGAAVRAVLLWIATAVLALGVFIEVSWIFSLIGWKGFLLFLTIGALWGSIASVSDWIRARSRRNSPTPN